MSKLASIVKGYTLGTMFVLVHVATHELRSRLVHTSPTASRTPTSSRLLHTAATASQRMPH